MSNKQYEDPNVGDPLSEPTPNRRIWAAYLRAGFTRTTFARAMDVSYARVNEWDLERSAYSLAHFMHAALVVSYSAEELVYGHAGPPMLGGEPELDDVEIRRTLARMRASGDECDALDLYRNGDAARQLRAHSSQRMTPTFVREFVNVVRSLRAARPSVGIVELLVRAEIAALAARANRDALDAGQRAFNPADYVKQPTERRKVRGLPLGKPTRRK